MRAEAKGDFALDAELTRLLPDALAAQERLAEDRPDRTYIAGLITRYLQSHEFGRMAPRTRKDRRRALDAARLDLGDMELAALDARRARAVLLQWRQERWPGSPRTADAHLDALAQLLQWACDRGEIARNPLDRWPRLYRANRAEVIWTDEQLASLAKHSSKEFRTAVQLAVLTGLRLGDLVKVTWASVQGSAIVWQTAKSSGTRVAVVPVTQELTALLAGIPKRATTILTSSASRPWTVFGLQTAMQRAKRDAQIVGPRFHDLRGTAATRFVRAGLSLEDVATILGWRKEKVERIAFRYVTASEVGLALANRLNERTGTLATKRL